MGAGASTADPQEEIRTIRKGQVAEDASAGAILVKSASGLTKSSGWLDEPDPYAGEAAAEAEAAAAAAAAETTAAPDTAAEATTAAGIARPRMRTSRQWQRCSRRR